MYTILVPYINQNYHISFCSPATQAEPSPSKSALIRALGSYRVEGLNFKILNMRCRFRTHCSSVCHTYSPAQGLGRVGLLVQGKDGSTWHNSNSSTFSWRLLPHSRAMVPRNSTSKITSGQLLHSRHHMVHHMVVVQNTCPQNACVVLDRSWLVSNSYTHNIEIEQRHCGTA